MMEKWGWSKGQGLGKDNSGITSCIVMKKIDGSSSQARITQSKPLHEPEPKRLKVEDDPNSLAIVPVGASGSYDIDPRDADAAAAAAESAKKQQETIFNSGSNYGMGLNGMPMKRRERIRQWVVDDWRWSKGTEALKTFEEVQLPPQLLTLARKILGEGSRYPARITDDTDCIVEVTAWNTLLVRPRGTGARMEVAKRMLYEVLHPHAHELREEALISPEEMARVAEEASKSGDNTVHLEGDDDATRRMTEGLKRSRHGNLNRVGIGAEGEVEAEHEVPEAAAILNKHEIREMDLDTYDDVVLVRAHLEDLRIATGVVPVIMGTGVRLAGKDKAINKAMQLIKTLCATGEWVALKEGFVHSSDTKEKKRGDGPSEQILIKVPEGPAVEKVQKYLHAIERASVADKLKLTSKAVGGKRTLMVQGTKSAHERVKLMVKELVDLGESPMLTKELGVARANAQSAEAALDAMMYGTPIDSEPMIDPPTRAAAPQPKKPGVVSASAGGVISAAAKLTKGTDSVSHKPVGLPTVGQGMRRLPPPKLAAQMASGADLFADLPATSTSSDNAGVGFDAALAAAEASTMDWDKVPEWDPAKGEMQDAEGPESNKDGEDEEQSPLASAEAFPPKPPSSAAAAELLSSSAELPAGAGRPDEAAESDPVIE